MRKFFLKTTGKIQAKVPGQGLFYLKCHRKSYVAKIGEMTITPKKVTNVQRYISILIHAEQYRNREFPFYVKKVMNVLGQKLCREASGCGLLYVGK